MSERLICRFCDKSNWRILFDASTHAQQVECASCLARGPLADSHDNAVAAWNRRAPAAEQQFIEVDGIRVDTEWVRRMRGKLDSMDWKLQETEEKLEKLEAEQQQQEPVADERLSNLMALWNQGVAQSNDLCQLIDLLLKERKLYTHQQPQAQGDSVSVPQNADQAQMMANLGIAWLQANAPERLKPTPVQGESVATPLQWSGHLKPDDQVSYDHLIGNTPFGRILITWKSWKDDWDLIIDEHPVESARGCFAGSTIKGAIETAEQKYLEALRGAMVEQPRAAVPTGWAVLPDDLRTHLVHFKVACSIARDNAQPPDGIDQDDKRYWQHQINVIDRIQGMLAAAPDPAGGA